MNLRKIFFINNIIFILFLSSFISLPISSNSNAGSTVVSTDSTHDITEAIYNVTSNSTTVLNGQSMDNIDISSISYGNNTNGNATISLNLLGTPTINENTSYMLLFDGGNDNISFTGWSVYQVNNNSYLAGFLTIDGSFLNFNTTSYLAPNSVTWIFPKSFSLLNYSTFQTFTVNFTLTPQSYWTWTGLTSVNETNYSGLNTQTTWFDKSDSTITTNSTTTSTSSSSTTTTSTSSTTTISTSSTTTNPTISTNPSSSTKPTSIKNPSTSSTSSAPTIHSSTNNSNTITSSPGFGLISFF